MKQKKGIEVGDLVYHLIYGKEWVAIVLDMLEVHQNCTGRKQLCREYVLVHMQSGTKYESFFRTSSETIRHADNRGLISHHWLRGIRD